MLEHTNYPPEVPYQGAKGPKDELTSGQPRRLPRASRSNDRGGHATLAFTGGTSGKGTIGQVLSSLQTPVYTFHLPVGVSSK